MDAAVVHRLHLTRELNKMKRLEGQAVDEINAALEKRKQALIKIEELEKELSIYVTPTPDPNKEFEEKLLSFI